MQPSSIIVDKLIDDALISAIDDSFVDAATIDDKEAYDNHKFPVDVIEFAESTEFLNLKGQLYKEIINLLIDIEDKSIREADLIIGKGGGKSLLAQVFSLYGCYTAGSLKNPQAVFRLTANTPLYSVNVSVSARQAKDNVFAGIKYLVERSEYFKGIALIKSEEIELPKGIRLLCGHSNFTAFLGYPIFRAVMDEVNFMFDNNNRSVSKQLYSALRGSLKTRFPGSYKLLSISSDSLPNSFLRERVQSLKQLIKEENNSK